jgi:hypothetical protein
MATKWHQHQKELLDFTDDRLNLAQLYNAIDSPAAGNWQDLLPQDEHQS